MKENNGKKKRKREEKKVCRITEGKKRAQKIERRHEASKEKEGEGKREVLFYFLIQQTYYELPLCFNAKS